MVDPRNEAACARYATAIERLATCRDLSKKVRDEIATTYKAITDPHGVPGYYTGGTTCSHGLDELVRIATAPCGW